MQVPGYQEEVISVSDQVKFLPTRAKFISKKVSPLILHMHCPSAFFRVFLQLVLCSCKKQSALHMCPGSQVECEHFTGFKILFCL